MTGGVPPGTASVNPAYWEDQTNVVSTPGGWLQSSPHRALTVDEIRAIIGDREAAARAKAAGFDGAEIHSGNGYLLDIEPRVKGNMVVAEGQAPVAAAQLRKIFKGRLVAAGGFEPDKAEAVVRAGDADAVAFGRHFIANPDLPVRIRRGYPLARHDRDTFYTFDARGYTDYPAYSATAN
jgi:2,4-dienoyl-CoA reductase-like NADH-dependent reductase (Old Yellow Enzyme family)